MDWVSQNYSCMDGAKEMRKSTSQFWPLLFNVIMFFQCAYQQFWAMGQQIPSFYVHISEFQKKKWANHLFDRINVHSTNVHFFWNFWLKNADISGFELGGNRYHYPAPCPDTKRRQTIEARLLAHGAYHGKGQNWEVIFDILWFSIFCSLSWRHPCIRKHIWYSIHIEFWVWQLFVMDIPLEVTVFFFF